MGCACCPHSEYQLIRDRSTVPVISEKPSFGPSPAVGNKMGPFLETQENSYYGSRRVFVC